MTRLLYLYKNFDHSEAFSIFSRCSSQGTKYPNVVLILAAMHLRRPLVSGLHLSTHIFAPLARGTSSCDEVVLNVSCDIGFARVPETSLRYLDVSSSMYICKQMCRHGKQL